MTLNEYQAEAMRTASRTATAHEDNLLLNGVMGLNGEAGEVIDMVKKMLFQGHTLDKDHMAKQNFFANQKNFRKNREICRLNSLPVRA